MATRWCLPAGVMAAALCGCAGVDSMFWSRGVDVAFGAGSDALGPAGRASVEALVARAGEVCSDGSASVWVIAEPDAQSGAGLPQARIRAVRSLIDGRGVAATAIHERVAQVYAQKSPSPLVAVEWACRPRARAR